MPSPELKTIAGLMDEAATIISRMPRELFVSQEVRHALCDELHGASIILREGSAAMPALPPAQEARQAVRGALVDADHLAACAEQLLAALNRKAGAAERVSAVDWSTDGSDEGVRNQAELELEQAEEICSELFQGVKSATHEYRKRAERARAALDAAPQQVANSPDLGDKRMSELTPAEQAVAKEQWLRAQIGHFPDNSQKHIAFLLEQLDAARGTSAPNPLSAEPVKYNTSNPVKSGTYACRVLEEDGHSLLQDKFLFWDGHRWGYPGSDQRYRSEVAAWVGPLQRRLNADTAPQIASTPTHPVAPRPALPRQQTGQLAREAGLGRHPLCVLQSAAGYYLGTAGEDGPMSRESLEYWPTRPQAQDALDGKAEWTQLDTVGDFGMHSPSPARPQPKLRRLKAG